MSMKLAEALILRKSLEAKVQQLAPLKINGENGLFETKVQRKTISENVDEATIQVPRIALADITATYDFYARQLRLCDAAIQKANWTAEVDFDEGTPPKAEKAEAPKPAEAPAA